MPSPFTTAFILEDLADCRDWLSQALAAAFPGIAVTSAASLQEGRSQLAAGLRPDIALIDLGLPDGSGVELIAAFHRHSPATLCVVASIYDDDEHIFPALRAGARGYLLKDQSVAAIVRALTGMAAGEPPLSPVIARRVLSFFSPAEPEALADLTAREREVLGCIARGLTQAETAQALGISRHTVTGYVKEIYRKLNVSSRAEAALLARDMGLA